MEMGGQVYHRPDQAVRNEQDPGEPSAGEALAAIQLAAACGTKVVAVGQLVSAADAAGSGGDAASGGGIDSARVEKEAEEAEGPPISWVQDEVLCIILSLLDAKTLLIAVPQVCKFWRSMCKELDGVHLDFRWWGEKKVPLQVVAGWRVLPTLVAVGSADCVGDVSAEGDEAAAGAGAQQEGRWASGMCALFPGTTSVTMGRGQEVKDAHLLALADKCRGLTHADFQGCWNLTDAAVLELADKCRGLTHAAFAGCDQLTDAAVLAFADKCLGLTHANFWGCENLTDAAVLGLADKCRGLTHADFSWCGKLTDAATATVLEQRPNCSFVF